MNTERFQQQLYSGTANTGPALQADLLLQPDAGEKQALLFKLLAESMEMAIILKVTCTGYVVQRDINELVVPLYIKIQCNWS